MFYKLFGRRAGATAERVCGEARGRLRAHDSRRFRVYLTHVFIISFRKSTPPQNRQLNLLNRHSKQQVDDFVGVLTY